MFSYIIQIYSSCPLSFSYISFNIFSFSFLLCLYLDPLKQSYNALKLTYNLLHLLKNSLKFLYLISKDRMSQSIFLYLDKEKKTITKSSYLHEIPIFLLLWALIERKKNPITNLLPFLFFIYTTLIHQVIYQLDKNLE